MKRLATSIAVAAMLASPLLAQAQARVSGTASFSNFSYTLVDLLPDDGIAPSLSLVATPDYPTNMRVYGNSHQSGTREPTYTDGREQSTTSFNRDLAVDLDTAHGRSGGSLTGATLDTLALQVFSSLDSGPGLTGAAQGYAHTEHKDFVLSPGTQVSFFTDFNGSASISQAYGSPLRERVEIQVHIGNSPPGSPGYASIFADNWTPDATGPATVSASERLSVLFTNTSTSDLRITLNMEMSSHVFTDGTLAPVPEPATTAMLAAGLALVAGAAHRRRKRAC